MAQRLTCLRAKSFGHFELKDLMLMKSAENNLENNIFSYLNLIYLGCM